MRDGRFDATIAVLAEDRRSRTSVPWLPFVALFTVGVSLALPCDLLQRELFLAEVANTA
ncbi:MAG: DUF2834 domain-containing protein [Bryobacterales bacterium]|nr:DUF2834 domain-containing protein [Bryobacterales bacterium]